jgi:hypothetical protein
MSSSVIYLTPIGAVCTVTHIGHSDGAEATSAGAFSDLGRDVSGSDAARQQPNQAIRNRGLVGI